MGKSVKIKSHREISDVIKCKACGKKHMAMLWPKMPSTGKPRSTCCGSGSGANRISVFKDREVLFNGETYYRCNKCRAIKPPSDFYHANEKPNSVCKPCKKEGIYNSPSSVKSREQAELNRRKASEETKTCHRCGETSLVIDWPRRPSGGLNETCCRGRERRQREELIASGRSICTSCKQTKSLKAFYVNKKGKPNSWCRDCSKAHMTNSGSREKRQRLIEQTCDGTLDRKTVGQLFGGYKQCPCCGSEMKRNDKHLDHIKPLSKGGKHSIYNAIILCASCNLSKGSKDFSEWFRTIPNKDAERFIYNLEGNNNLSHIMKEALKCRQQVA